MDGFNDDIISLIGHIRPVFKFFSTENVMAFWYFFYP